MEMYPKNDLYSIYKKNIHDNVFSSKIPDLTKKRTLEIINIAINCCEDWGASLDIGAGSGHYTIPLLSKFKKSIVVEVAKHEEHNYLKNMYTNFEYHNSFIEDIVFEEKFDFVLLADIFEHIKDTDTFVHQIARLQNYGGVVYVLTPNPFFCGPASQSGIYYTRHKDGHRKHYLPNEITRIMEKNGYELILKNYEEGGLRQKVKRILKAFSRRDKILDNRLPFYKKILSPVIFSILHPLLLVIEWYVYRNEYFIKDNVECTMATTFIFKKYKK